MFEVARRVDEEILEITTNTKTLFSEAYAGFLCIGCICTRAGCVQGEYMLVKPWKLEKMKMQRF